MDNWKIVLSHSEIKTYVNKCANVINNEFQNADLVCVCILKGATYFFVDITRSINIPHAIFFVSASSYKDEQLQSKCEITGDFDPKKFENKTVLLIDELHDSGETLHQIKEAFCVRANVPRNMIFTCTAFVKNKETKYEKPDIYGCTVPNVWLVGYGLDHKQKYRNLCDLMEYSSK